jgi:methyl-accepting chemotaxis protein
MENVMGAPAKRERTTTRKSAVKQVAKNTFDSIDEVIGLLENAPTNIIYCENDLVIKYLNPSSKRTLQSIEQHLPISVDKIEGSSIDIFHKNPAHQRKLLSDDRNLPIKANIHVGPEILDLMVSAIYNSKKEYVGAMVVWDVITKKLETENEMAQIYSMMENAPINILYCGLDFKISYINLKSKETLKSIESLLPIKVETILGSSIDVFHRNPAHQRRILADERNYPHRAVIKLGDQSLDLLMSAIFDKNRKMIGSMVTWSVVTERVLLVKTLEEASAQLGAAAEELSATATELARNSDSTNRQASTASASAEVVSRGVQTVATNTEEMSAAIKEIARSSSEAASMSKQSMQQTLDTNATISKLGASSREVGSIVKVISSIAQQTNLLALNATIEAARAGDAGKGFAVVANEVKELAKQTAKATDQIAAQIAAIQGDSESAVGAIGGIAKAIEKLNGISMTIAAAVEEQAATTNEVARVVQDSSRGVEGIAGTIKNVMNASSESSAGAAQTLEAAKSLSQLALRLKDLISRIKV